MTPEEIAALSACFRCLADRQSALLFLLARIANVSIEEIIAGSACFRCLSDFSAAQLFLLNSIATSTAAAAAAAAATAGQVQCGDVAPTAAPTNACTLYYDRVSTALYYWNATTASWVLKV